MFKICVILILLYINIGFELFNSNICLQHASHFSQGRRENVKITRNFDTLIKYFYNVLFFVFVVLVTTVELSIIFSRSFSYVRFDLNLSLFARVTHVAQIYCQMFSTIFSLFSALFISHILIRMS